MTNARSRHRPGGRSLGAATLSALGLSLALLGASASATPAADATAAHTTAAQAKAKAKVVADWKAFFSGKTAAKRKILLVQDGSAFAPVIRAQAGSVTSQAVTASVAKVTFNKTLTKATVVYTIDIAGKAALANQKGTAILQGGTWKVGAQSFCALLALEGSAKQVRACSAKG
jgi:hypothetical protein